MTDRAPQPDLAEWREKHPKGPATVEAAKHNWQLRKDAVMVDGKRVAAAAGAREAQWIREHLADVNEFVTTDSYGCPDEVEVESLASILQLYTAEREERLRLLLKHAWELDQNQHPMGICAECAAIRKEVEG